MSTSRTIAKAPPWQRARVLILHRAFLDLYAKVSAESLPLVPALHDLSATLHGQPIDSTHTLRAAPGTLTTLWYKWLAGNRTAASLIPSYAPAHPNKMPDLLVREIQKLFTAPTGGRDKHRRGIEAAGVHKILTRRWRAGEDIPGLGTWRTWWAANHPGLPEPATAPSFPWSAKTVSRKKPAKPLCLAGNIGSAAANAALPEVRIDYSRLRKCELYTLDDVRLDVAAINEVTGRVCGVTCYILMEAASRSIPAFVLKPDLKSITAEDVNELLAHGLQVEGYGIGVGYVTHIKFERGTVACTPAAQAVLEGATDGRIKVLRTSMDGAVKYSGAPAERAIGHAAGKAIIESFNRNLHRRLIHLPGQRGNAYQNEPQSLDFAARRAASPASSQGQTLTRAAERLADFQATARRAGVDSRLPLPLLTVSQLREQVRLAIHDHNTASGHQMQGFHRFTEAEVSPGVWTRIDAPPTQA